MGNSNFVLESRIAYVLMFDMCMKLHSLFFLHPESRLSPNKATISDRDGKVSFIFTGFSAVLDNWFWDNVGCSYTEYSKVSKEAYKSYISEKKYLIPGWLSRKVIECVKKIHPYNDDLILGYLDFMPDNHLKSKILGVLNE